MHRLVVLESVNAYKPAIPTRVRLIKAYEVRRLRPRGIILGTSRSHVGLRPSHDGWDPAARPVYNLAFDGATTKEMYHYLRHAHAVRPLRQVVLGLDTYHATLAPATTRPDFDAHLLDSPAALALPSLIRADLKVLTSLDTLRASLERSSRRATGRRSGSHRTGNASATCSSGGRASTSGRSARADISKRSIDSRSGSSGRGNSQRMLRSERALPGNPRPPARHRWPTSDASSPSAVRRASTCASSSPPSTRTSWRSPPPSGNGRLSRMPSARWCRCWPKTRHSIPMRVRSPCGTSAGTRPSRPRPFPSREVAPRWNSTGTRPTSRTSWGTSCSIGSSA